MIFGSPLRGSFQGPPIYITAGVGTTGTKLHKYGYNGVLQWEFSRQFGPTLGPPCVDNQGRCYISSDDGFVTRLNPNGSVDWEYNNGVGGNVAANNSGECWISDDNGVKRLDNSGALVWSTPIANWSGIGAEVDGDDNFYTIGDGGPGVQNGIYRFDSIGNSEVMIEDFRISFTSRFVVDADGAVYVTQPYGDAADGLIKYNSNGDLVQVIRENPNDMQASSLAIDADRNLYRGGQNEQVWVFDSTGQLYLVKSIGSNARALSVDERGYFYAGTTTGVRKYSETGIGILFIQETGASRGVEAFPGRFTVAGHN